MSDFKWPWQYNFPPFFTVQPTLQTREKQLEAWASLVLDYCQKKAIYSVELNEVAQSELFQNQNINRKLSIEGIRLIFDLLEQRGHVEWKDKAKQRCGIFWRKPEEWGQLIYQWAKSIGLINTVITFYEITSGEDSTNESFYGLDTEVLVKALRHLESQGRAIIVDADRETGGVKFV